MGAIRKFFANVVSGLVINKAKRKKVRVILNSPMMSYVKFIRRDLGDEKIQKMKTFIGYRARSLIIGVNDKYIYKFPLQRSNYRELAMREKRIVDAFQNISPIAIPPVELLTWRGILVRKYKYVPGKTVSQFDAADILRHKTKLARQVANFMYVIGQSDPAEIRDLKPNPDEKPGFMAGWCQGDICDNFMIDDKTFNVLYFIDWEDCAFAPFECVMGWAVRTPGRELMAAVRSEYEKIYNKHHKK